MSVLLTDRRQKSRPDPYTLVIPIAELSNGGYEGLGDSEKNEKLSSDFRAFLSARAEFICKAARRLAEGHQLSTGEFYSNV